LLGAKTRRLVPAVKPKDCDMSRIAMVAVLCAALGACSALPASGPTEREVLAAEKQDNPIGFRILNVTPAVVTALQRAERPSFTALDIVSRPARVDAIGPGDTLNIAIYEIGNAIFSGGGTASPPATGGEAPAGTTSASGTRLPPVQVDASGNIDLPYIGRVHAAGRTPAELEGVIRAGLHSMSQDPQVVVSLAESVSTAIFVQGDVKNPGRRLLTLNHERLLDAVALAGGTTFPPQDMLIELTRDGRAVRVPLRQVEDNPLENVVLRPGDRVRLIHQVRSFTVFGAAGKVSEVPLEAADVSLIEGVARAGGPTDERADPNAVFLFRFEPPAVADNLGVPALPGSAPGAARPVIYKLDMMNPTSYFLAQRFPMENKDLIYVANARSDRFSKFVSIVYSLALPVITGASLAQ
jgi:polysaccharide export outer membrane protein